MANNRPFQEVIPSNQLVDQNILQNNETNKEISYLSKLWDMPIFAKLFILGPILLFAIFTIEKFPNILIFWCLILAYLSTSKIRKAINKIIIIFVMVFVVAMVLYLPFLLFSAIFFGYIFQGWGN